MLFLFGQPTNMCLSSEVNACEICDMLFCVFKTIILQLFHISHNSTSPFMMRLRRSVVQLADYLTN